MALSDDQRALLRLLAKREEGYEDIAALKGLSVEQIRAEVKDALAELDAADQTPPSPSSAKPPELGPRVRAKKPKPTPSSRPRPTIPAVPAERRRLLVFAGGALGIVAIVLALIALIGDGSDSGSDSTTDSTTELTAAENSKVTQAVLSAADGSDASGRAVFGRVGKEEIVLQVTAENLESTEPGQSYTVWLYRSPKLSLRVGSAPVSDDGRFGAQLPIPAELLAYIAGGAFDQIYISRLDNAAYKQEVARAKQNKSLPRYSGETVLTGEITGPIAKAAAEAQGG